MIRFGLIGASGYIAPRHMEAIRNVKGELVTILDPNDSVGIIDRYHPTATYFSEYERFDREVDRLKRMGKGLNFISIASPNYLHDAHIRFSLKNGCSAICEKPLVLNPYSIGSLEDLEKETNKKIYPILQLRLHQSIIDLKEKIGKNKNNKKINIENRLEVGDAVIFYGSLIHGVDSVDPQKKLIWNSNEGRWFLGMFVNDSDHVKNRITAKDLTRSLRKN